MHPSAGCSRNYDQQWMSLDSDDVSLPQDLRRPLEEGHRKQLLKESRKVAHEDARNQMKGKARTHPEPLIQSQNTCVPGEDQRPQDINTFWISVSGYEHDRTRVVYRFFYDIGHIVGKCFTDTDRMYLKYFSMPDCQIALSYNGQKIGYGGDIKVTVKPENPVTERAIIEALEEYDDNISSTTVTTDVGESGDQKVSVPNTHQLEIGQARDFEIIRKRVGIRQWFREKLAYMFYFY